ncbi:ABC transporter permease [Ruminiclostridium josui]|uniref:ABC transporter permease n=1 Tax=Ruminiclostridium josui TaxID=1499 RepID=UPI000464E780|nr:ABC transporter permease [Ruminiclostridium josui]
MILKLLRSEQLKLKRTGLIFMTILIPLAINMLITIDLQFRYTGYLLIHQQEMNISCWQLILKEQRILFFPALLPFFATLILTQIFSVERRSNGWSMILTQPIKRYQLLLSKYIISCKYITILIVVNIVTMAIAGFITGIKDPFDTELFLRCFLILLVSTFATAAIQLIAIEIFPSKWISLFIGLFLGLLSQDTYINSVFGKFNPYSFSDFSYRSDWNQAVFMILISCIYIIIGLLASTSIFKRKNIYR